LICVDASVALKWLFEEEHSDRALALAEYSARRGELLIAPALFPFEVANVVLKYVRRTGLDPAVVSGLLERLDAFGVEIRSARNQHHDAIQLALRLSLGSTYDAHYVTLASATSSTLWTADRRLINAVNETVPFVRWIGDFENNPPAHDRGLRS